VFWQAGCSQISMSWLESNRRLKSNSTGSVWTATLGGENECDRHRIFEPGDVLRGGWVIAKCCGFFSMDVSTFNFFRSSQCVS
jgi:hypothetical protein